MTAARLPQFHSLTVRAITRETPDAVMVSFALPQPLQQDYAFKAGQFITLRREFKGREERRSYSLCLTPDESAEHSELRVGVKAVPGGLFSDWINRECAVGDAIDVMTPDGRFFTPLDPQHSKHYVAFAGGSGITPILSLIATTLALEPYSRFTLVYGNRTVNSIMFCEALEDLKNRYLGRFRLVNILTDEPQEIALFHGLLDAAKCDELLRSVIPAISIDEVFVCGPAPMMDAVEAQLLVHGVDRTKIHLERFGTPLPQAGAAKPLAATHKRAQVDLIFDGQTRRLAVPYEGQAILDAGLAAGAALPYACKAGVCCTCRAKVLEGKVRMDKNFTLEDREVEQGFVLTCQSHPITERVVVSYDFR